MGFKPLRAAALLLCLLMVSAADGRAARHALLVGVGAYPHLAASKQLEGPSHDVAALAALLKERHGFPSSHILSLVDGEATRAAVLRELERLVERVERDDLVVIYFSGHGTSSHEFEAWGFSAYTGALLPYDFKMDRENVEKMKEGLIVGRRDIRPLLERLDRKSPRVLAVFDACYSGYTIRSCRKTAARSRYVALPLKDLIGGEKPGKHGEETAEKPDYPYRNVVYVSASSSEEQAWDITRGLIWNGKKTFDNRPHGAMTDALLHGLDGAADTNGDEEMTVNELYHFIKSTVSRGFAQTPQLLHAENRADMLDDPIFRLSREKEIQAMPAAVSGPLRVRMERIPRRVRSAVERLPGVRVVEEGAYDILVTPRKLVKRDIRRFINLYLANGRLLDQVPIRSVVQRLKRHTRIERLIAHTYPEATFNVFLELIGARGVLLEDDPVGFTIRTEADAHLLLINIDPTGGINILYPFMEEDLRPVRAGSPLELPELGYVSPPNFGIEHIKVFAFKERPPGLARFMGESFPPDSPLFDDLMALIDTRSGAAQATLAVQTAPRSEVVLADGEGAD